MVSDTKKAVLPRIKEIPKEIPKAKKAQRVKAGYLNDNPWWAQLIIGVILIILCIITIFPMVNLLALSLSSPQEIEKNSLLLIPKGFTIEAYKYIFSTPVLSRSFGITVFVTVVGTVLNLIFTTTAAYGLSKTQIPFYKLFMTMIIIPMLIGAGLIPSYILYKNLNLIDSVWVMILPGLVSPFNLILMRNFIWSIPDSLEESAFIDGANEIYILWKIIVPLSMPVIATVGLFYAVGHWNDFFLGLFFIGDNSKWPLQVILRSIIIDLNMMNMGFMEEVDPTKVVVTPENIKAATIIFSIVPILAAYPYLQKYFVKGVMLGSVKG